MCHLERISSGKCRDLEMEETKAPVEVSLEQNIFLRAVVTYVVSISSDLYSEIIHISWKLTHGILSHCLTRSDTSHARYPRGEV